MRVSGLKGHARRGRGSGGAVAVEELAENVRDFFGVWSCPVQIRHS